jgi:hypothetical protein
MGGDYVCCIERRWHRARFAVLLIVVGLLWLAQRAGWPPLGIFGPFVLLALGLWMIVTSRFQKRQAPPSLLVSPLPRCGS